MLLHKFTKGCKPTNWNHHRSSAMYGLPPFEIETTGAQTTLWYTWWSFQILLEQRNTKADFNHLTCQSFSRRLLWFGTTVTRDEQERAFDTRGPDRFPCRIWSFWSLPGCWTIWGSIEQTSNVQGFHHAGLQCACLSKHENFAGGREADGTFFPQATAEYLEKLV